MASRLLTKWDEYLVHQTADPIAAMAGEEAEWCDWLWQYAGPPGPGPMVQAAYVVYPNRGTASGFALINAGDKQYNLRGTRMLGPDRTETTLGPLHFEVVEPQKRWRCRLEDNDYLPVTFDLRFEATEPPYLCQKVVAPADRHGSVQQAWGHYTQGGRQSGTLRIGDERYTLDRWPGFRDRSWGLRSVNMGIGLWVWLKAHLPGRQLFVIYQEDIDGSKVYLDGVAYDEVSGHASPIEHLDVRLDLLPITREITSASLVARAADGRLHRLSVIPLSSGTYMRGAWAERPWHEAEPFMSGEVWDLDEENKRALGKWLREKHVRYEQDGEVGYGIFEYGVSGRHPVYGPMVRGK